MGSSTRCRLIIKCAGGGRGAFGYVMHQHLTHQYPKDRKLGTL